MIGAMRWTMLNSNYKNNFNHLVFPHVTGLHVPGCHSAKQISGIRHLIVFSAAMYPKTSFRSTSDGARWLLDCVSELMVGGQHRQEREAAINTDWIYFHIHSDWKHADHLSVLSKLDMWSSCDLWSLSTATAQTGFPWSVLMMCFRRPAI